MRLARAGALLAALAAGSADAQSLTGAREWLPPGSLALPALLEQPREALDGGEKQSFLVEFGRLAFRSPEVLGGTARKAGLSCQACHVGGHVNAHFFIPQLSDRPGAVDVTHALWHARNEDNRFNPREIPSLRGVAQKPRLGFDKRSGSLREFTRNVMVLEFAAAEPSALVLDALVAYQQALLPGAPGVEPVTLRRDLADLARHLRVLALPLAEEDAEAGELAIAMIRGQIGFIHERFEDEALRGQQQILEQWSRELAAIANLARDGLWPLARQRRDALAAVISVPPPELIAAEKQSLYDPERLKAWLSRPVP